MKAHFKNFIFCFSTKKHHLVDGDAAQKQAAQARKEKSAQLHTALEQHKADEAEQPVEEGGRVGGEVLEEADEELRGPQTA